MDRNVCGSGCGDKVCGSVAPGDKLGEERYDERGKCAGKGVLTKLMTNLMMYKSNKKTMGQVY